MVFFSIKLLYQRHSGSSSFAKTLFPLTILILWIGLIGCSMRPTSQVLKPLANVPASTKKVPLLVATTRERGSAEDPDAFTERRAKDLNFAALTVSIPSQHVPGEIEWPDASGPNPSKHFVTTQREFLDADEFLNRIRARAKSGSREANDILIFVHGYNTRYEEAVYWLAQIINDSGFEGTAVLFAWPSHGKAPLYLADREASTYSRDYFEQALVKISKLPEVKEINILGHSMGNWLVVEALRQAKMNGHGTFNGKLAEVMLASPDLDVNVFRTQLDVIGNLPRPITVLVSGDDKALALSTMLAGDVDRVGSITAEDMRAIEGAKHYNLRVVDLTAVNDGDGNHHSKYSKSSAVMSAIGKGLKNKKTETIAEVGLVTSVTNVGNTLLQAPAKVFQAADDK
ncbi:MAG: alpha/beta hydrolase [Hyphomicrobium sp.]